MLGSLAVLALMGVTMAMASLIDDSPDQDETAPEETPDEIDTDLPPDPEDADTGATLMQAEDGTITIDVGDDEPGSLSVFVYKDTQDDPDNFVSTYEARFYLVPEGTDLPGNDRDEATNIPGLTDQFTYEIDDLDATLGLQLLGTLDLGVENADIPDQPGALRDELPPIEANRPFDVFFVEASTDQADIQSFLGEDAFGTFNGAPLTETAADATGTDAPDWIILTGDAAAGSVIEGLDGDDRLETSAESTAMTGGAGNDALFAVADSASLNGGSGDDTILAAGNDAEIMGGIGNDSVTAFGDMINLRGDAGDDTIGVFGSGVVLGGDGADQITANSQGGPYAYSSDDFAASGTVAGGSLDVFGGNGNDGLSLTGAQTTGHGGAGNDLLSVGAGAVGHGDEGNDSFAIDSGATATGGDGDDSFQVWNRLDQADGTPVLTGGAGADVYDARVQNPAGDSNPIFLRITDFDPAEDMLQVGVFQTSWASVNSVAITEAADGSHSDVEVGYIRSNGDAAATAIIRLDGVTGLTPDQIVIA